MRWIKVGDAKPSDAKPVIVFVPEWKRQNGDRGVFFGRYVLYAEGRGEWYVDGSPSAWNVTHWMPLPDEPSK